MINRRINLNSRNFCTDEINNMTMVTIDLNKRIADKLKVNADFILNKIDVESRIVSDSFLNKKRNNDDTVEIRNNNQEKKSTSKLNITEDQKETFKIELSLRDDDNYNLTANKLTSKQVILNKNINEIDQNKSSDDALIKHKWNLTDEKRSEFKSTDKIVMILKDKNTFMNNNEIIQTSNKIEKIADPQQESKLVEEETRNPANSDSDSESEIEIPDIF